MAKLGRNNKGGGFNKAPMEFEQSIVDLARVTRVMAGGKRLRFRACVVLGDKRGRVGWGIAKGADVAMAVSKAVNQAKKNIIKIKLVNGTIPHKIEAKFKASRVMLKPAVSGTGIIAGGAVRTLMELAGVPNVYSKILSRTSNKISNLEATFKALSLLKYPVVLDDSQPLPIAEVIDENLPADLLKDEELEQEQAKLLKKVGLPQDLPTSKLIDAAKPRFFKKS